MGMNSYDLGQLVRLKAPFTAQADGAVIDPDAVYLKILDPDDELTIYQYGVDDEIVKSSAGNYQCDFSPAVAGIYTYCWYSTGEGQASAQAKFLVKETIMDDE